MSQSVEQLLDLATDAFNDGRSRDALHFAREVLGLDPSSAEAKLIEANALSRTGQPEAATTAFYEAINLDPRDASIRYNAAVHSFNIKDFVSAREQALETLDLEPTHEGARALLKKLPPDLPPLERIPIDRQTTPGYTRAESSADLAIGNPFIFRLGKAWTVLFFGLCLINLAQFAAVYAQLASIPIPKAFEQVTGLLGPVSILGLIVWMLMDSVHRRSNPQWLLLLIPLSCMGLGAVSGPLYWFAARNPAEPEHPQNV